MKVCFILVLGHRCETCTPVFYRGEKLKITPVLFAPLPRHSLEKMMQKKTCAPPFYRGCLDGGTCTPRIYNYKMGGQGCRPEFTGGCYNPVTLSTLPNVACWGERPSESQFSVKTPRPCFFGRRFNWQSSCNLNVFLSVKKEKSYKPVLPAKSNMEPKRGGVEVTLPWKGLSCSEALGVSLRFRCPKTCLTVVLCEWLVTPIYKPFFDHLTWRQPYLGDLRSPWLFTTYQGLAWSSKCQTG